MKNLTLLSFILFGCVKQTKEELPLNVVSASFTLPTEGPNLYIPEDEGGYDYPGRIGLYNGFKQIAYITVNSYLASQYLGKVAVGETRKVCYYDCFIANGIPGDTWDTTTNQPHHIKEVSPWYVVPLAAFSLDVVGK